MAEYSHPDDNAPLHSLVGRIVTDPSNPPNTVIVLGYLGSAGTGRDAYRRIYLDLDFRNYFEVAHIDILYAQKADPAHEELPTNIVINATANLTLVQTVEASYLKGAIASLYARGSPYGGFCPAPPTWIPSVCGCLPGPSGGVCGGLTHTFCCPGHGHHHTLGSPMLSPDDAHGCPGGPMRQTSGKMGMVEHHHCTHGFPHTYHCGSGPMSHTSGC